MDVEKNNLTDTVQLFIFPSPKSFPYFLNTYFSEGYLCLSFFFMRSPINNDEDKRILRLKSRGN